MFFVISTFEEALAKIRENGKPVFKEAQHSSEKQERDLKHSPWSTENFDPKTNLKSLQTKLKQQTS